MRSVIDLLWEDGKEKTPHPRLCRPIPGIVVTDKVEKHPFIRYAMLDCKVIIILIIDSDKGNGVEIDTVDYFSKKQEIGEPHLISCSSASNSGVEKNSARVMSRSSQIILSVRIFGSVLLP